MHLLFFNPYYPPHTGGLETHSADLNKHLAANKEITGITVFTPYLPAAGPREEHNGKIKIIRFAAIEIIPNFPFPAFWRAAFWKSWRQMKMEPCDIVLSRTRFFSTSVMALIHSRLIRRPWVHIEHGSDHVKLSNQGTSSIAKLWDYTLGWLIFNLSTVNVAISKAVASFVHKFNGRAAPVIYRGIEKEMIESIAPDTSIKQRYKNKTIVIFLGRLIDGKGAKDLIEAAEKLREEPLAFIIIGDGPQRLRLTQLVKDKKLETAIHFTGGLPLEKAIAIMKAGDIFVNPSYTEGLPTSVIEAALCKIAIIATDVGGTNEIITNNVSGWLIPIKSTTMIKERISALMVDKAKRQEFVTAAYSFVSQKFSWTESSHAYVSLFKKIIRN